MNYRELIRNKVLADYRGMFRPSGEGLKYPFITPGSKQYDDVLWDWDSWWANVALRQILLESGGAEALEEARP